MLQTVEIPPYCASEYVRQQLELNRAGGRLLGSLLEPIRFEEGRFWAYVPAESSGEAAADFELGAFTDEDRREMEVRVAEFLIDELRAAEPGRRLPIFEYWTDIDDMSLTAAKTFRVGNSVFDYADSFTPRDRVVRLVGSALWFPTVGLVGDLPAGVTIEDRGLVDYETLKQIATAPKLVMIGAWDADGYVMWTPPPDPMRAE